ncbi:hypothetical protein LVISKB_2341 [Levilactobacillus brevis KB290]|uniref:Uncharacterized protein n=1 Tax=Levilactobacillus brevis KB290 TaxID=1001583 RepID=M5B1K5_LEVBR|nr:hypothetical protein LVISKB_2341 [Levilactobacillus brevis KB290]
MMIRVMMVIGSFHNLIFLKYTLNPVKMQGSFG